MKHFTAQTKQGFTVDLHYNSLMEAKQQNPTLTNWQGYGTQKVRPNV